MCDVIPSQIGAFTSRFCDSTDVESYSSIDIPNMLGTSTIRLIFTTALDYITSHCKKRKHGYLISR